MPLDTGSLLRAVSLVAEERQVTVTVKKSAKAGAIAGGACFLGALMGGPVGIIIGGVVGTSLAYATAGEIKPLYRIINEDLTSEQRLQLSANLQRAFADLGPQDLALLGVLLAQNVNLQERAMKVALEFVTTQVTAG